VIVCGRASGPWATDPPDWAVPEVLASWTDSAFPGKICTDEYGWRAVLVPSSQLSRDLSCLQRIYSDIIARTTLHPKAIGLTRRQIGAVR
jgi:hypothetical protein